MQNKNSEGSTSTPLTSVRQLAQRIGYSHSCVNEWLRRSDWPFPTVGPWPLGVVDAIRAWANDPDRDRRGTHVHDDVIEVAAPGPYTVTTDDLFVTGGKLAIRPFIGETLFAELTTADLESLAEHLNAATIDAMMDFAMARGEPGLLREARPAYYRLLAREAVDVIAERFNMFGLVWLGRRFIDRPKWWTELSPPMPKPDAKWLAALTPLGHRAPKGEGAKP